MEGKKMEEGNKRWEIKETQKTTVRNEKQKSIKERSNREQIASLGQERRIMEREEEIVRGIAKRIQRKKKS